MVDKNMVVYPVSDSTRESIIIQHQIEGIQKMIKPYDGKEEEEPTKAVIEISLAAKRHWELQIKILRGAPRDPDKLREILKIKQRQEIVFY